MSKRRTRASFRSAVFSRDGYRCVVCGKPGRDRQGDEGHLAFHPAGTPLVPLDAHHVTPREEMPGGGYVPENGVSLCDEGCHGKAEAWLQERRGDPGYGPADLYRGVGSSLEQALEASRRPG